MDELKLLEMLYEEGRKTLPDLQRGIQWDEIRTDLWRSDSRGGGSGSSHYGEKGVVKESILEYYIDQVKAKGFTSHNPPLSEFLKKNGIRGEISTFLELYKSASISDLYEQKRKEGIRINKFDLTLARYSAWEMTGNNEFGTPDYIFAGLYYNNEEKIQMYTTPLFKPNPRMWLDQLKDDPFITNIADQIKKEKFVEVNIANGATCKDGIIRYAQAIPAEHVSIIKESLSKKLGNFKINDKSTTIKEFCEKYEKSTHSETGWVYRGAGDDYD